MEQQTGTSFRETKKYYLHLHQELDRMEAKADSTLTEEEKKYMKALYQQYLYAVRMVQERMEPNHAQTHYMNLRVELHWYEVKKQQMAFSEAKTAYVKELIGEIHRCMIFLTEGTDKNGEDTEVSPGKVKTYDFGEEQYTFVKGKRRLAYYTMVEQERPLTHKEKMEVDAIKTSFWQAIMKYASSLFSKSAQYYRTFGDSRSDVLQLCVVKMISLYPFYDPYRTRPTTFFKTRLQEEIRKYMVEYSQNMSMHYSKVLSKVKRAVTFFDSQGIEWDIPMISNRSGLSHKVVEEALMRAHTSTLVCLDDIEYCYSQTPTPEEAYIQEEKQREVYEAIRNRLTDWEWKVFMTKVDPEGYYDETKRKNADGITYEHAARLLGITPYEMRRQYNQILAKLQTDRKLRYLFSGQPEMEETHGQLIFMDSAAGGLEQQLLDGLGDAIYIAKGSLVPNNNSDRNQIRNDLLQMVKAILTAEEWSVLADKWKLSDTCSTKSGHMADRQELMKNPLEGRSVSRQELTKNPQGDRSGNRQPGPVDVKKLYESCLAKIAGNGAIQELLFFYDEGEGERTK